MELRDQFDAEELYHLALRASEKGQHEHAISLLKQSQSLRPSANTLYILAAEHAEIGMLRRAVEEMARATEMDPGLWTAHFQRGLLHMMLDQPAEAIDAWSPLEQLNEDEALYQFGRGMIVLLRGDTSEARRHLERGIALNHANPALNDDMNRVIDHIRDLGASIAESSESAPSDDGGHGDDSGTAKGHFFLTEYNKDDPEIH